MKRFSLVLLVTVTAAGCMSADERAARRAEKEQVRAERKSQRAEEDRQAKADEAARAEQQRQDDAKTAEYNQSVNVEKMCQTIANAYSQHCGGKPAKTFLWCLGNQSPATTASLNWGQTQACGTDVSSADCAVLGAGVLPASCGQISPATETTSTQPQKDPGGVSVGRACGPLMEQHCNKCNPSDMKACVDQSLSWCENGRDPNLGTGMSATQYSTCTSAYRQLRCDAANTGYVPMDCPGLR